MHVGQDYTHSKKRLIMRTHNNKIRHIFTPSAIALAVSASVLPVQYSVAQEIDNQIEKIEITATRRSGSVQEAPLNITALTSDTLSEQNIGDLDDVARWVPGLTVTDQGGRNDSPIVVRGLNTNSSGPGSDGGTVATYVGEIPLFINMRLNDIERVEVLIGPQGTLYGAGTLGGAIRYIPKKVELDTVEGQVYGDIFSLSESDSVGGEGGFVFNTPLIDDTLGLRFSFNKLHDPGFIDYNYVVQEGGVSLPDPDWTDPAAISANLKQVKDANGEDVTNTKIALRWAPNDDVDATLTYFYQKQEVEGRSITHFGSLAESNGLSSLMGAYESGYRYEEPREKIDELLTLEVKVDLGFAELVSATGKSSFEAVGQRDQTDLLIRLAYSYEDFPAFSSFTRELDNADIFTQEIRLVSQNESDLNWIVGGFYNKIETDGESREFTPGFSQFTLDVWETGGNLRSDALEYISVDDNETTEKAIFGEIGYKVNDKLDITLGARFYEYEVINASDVDLPLLYTSIAIENDGGDFRSGDEVVLNLLSFDADDSGSLFKFNASYKFTPDVMGYVTVSEGYRIGGANSVGACPPDLDEDTQEVCALEREKTFESDTTTNYELGFKSTWFKNRLHFNAALFNVDWDNAQIDGATVNGQQPITTNAGTANTNGVEISSRAILSDELTAYATYSYTNAELTENVPALFLDSDAFDGDRLPGTPESQFSFGLKYSTEVFDDKLLDVVYGLTAQSDINSKIGLHESGEVIAGFALSNLSASLSDENWAVTLYVDNLFDKYAFTSVRRDSGDIGLPTGMDTASNRIDLQRNYGHYLARPRQIGMKFTYNFEL
jgi:iron complex outermembrane receptor protein